MQISDIYLNNLYEYLNIDGVVIPCVYRVV